MSSTLLLLLCAVSVVVSKDTNRIQLAHEETPNTLTWQRGHRAQPAASFNFLVAFHTPFFHELERMFWDISDPDHVHFRSFLDHKTIAKYLSAPQQHHQAVRRWVSSDGGDAEMYPTQHGDYLSVSTTVQAAERLFAIQLHEWHTTDSHGRQRTTIRSSVPYTVPMRMRTFIKAVHGVTDFLPVVTRPRIVRSGRLSEPGQRVDPTIIRSLYNVSLIAKAKNSSQGVAEFEQAEFKQSDLSYFLKYYKLPNTTVIVDGPNNGGYWGEASLDVQYIAAVGANINATWDIAGDQFDLLKWGMRVGRLAHAPYILSVSWGSAEYEFPVDHIKAASVEMMKLGLAGHTVFVASGDHGTGNQGSFFCKKFAPQWPGTCPYVTAVGGTYLNKDGKTQTAWSGSGGGFSNVFGRPPYQTSAVSKYFTTAGGNLPEQKHWNRTGRGSPDVSALATNFRTYVSGFGTISGTSAATPTFAAVVSLVLDKFLLSGQHTRGLGFINPSLYRMGNVGFDVTSGSNKHYPCRKGFPATTGWDAVSGLGTPNYPLLQQGL